MNTKLVGAITAGAVLSGVGYYVWCSLQWRDAAQMQRAQQEVSGEATATPATPEPGVGASVEKSVTEVEAPTATPEPVQAFTRDGLVTLEARFSDTHLMRGSQTNGHIMLTARADADAAANIPAGRVQSNLVLVIDRSGSMRGERIEHAKGAARFLIDQLSEGDRISVVSYSDSAKVEVPSQSIHAGNRDTIKAAIDDITLRGDTCISCGIQEARQQLSFGQSELQASESRIILLSDGQANRGLRTVPQLTSQARRIERTGVVMTTVGVGLDYNEQIMSNLAISGNGNHYFVEDPRTLSVTLSRELENLNRLVATRAVASFKLAPGVRFLRGFDREFRSNGDTVMVSLGSITAGAELTGLIEVSVPAHLEGIQPVSEITLSYHNLATDRPELLSGHLETHVTNDFQLASNGLDVEVAARFEQAQMNLVLEQANNEIAVGNVSGAQQMIRKQKRKSRKKRSDWGKDADRLDASLNAFDELDSQLGKGASTADRKRASKSGSASRRALAF